MAPILREAVSSIRREWGLLPLLADVLLFCCFLFSMLVLFSLRNTASTWAMVAHLLCNGGLMLLVLRHWLLGRPSLYWSHFDIVIVLLFLYFGANVYYSEIREVSWRTAALYLDCLAAYFFGRMFFYHRVRSYAIVLLAGLALAWGGTALLRSDAARQEADLREQVAAATSSPDGQVGGVDTETLQSRAEYQRQVGENLAIASRTITLLLAFWVVTLPFLLFRQPSGLAFFLYGLLILGGYGVYAAFRFSWLWGFGEANAVALRHEKVESLLTAIRILQNYPITGSGSGTFRYMYNAYRLTPSPSFQAGFNSFLFFAVELGLAALLVLLYLLVRIPLHVIRRWRLFPHRRLRFAVFAHLLFVLLFLVQGFHDPHVFTPACWFVAWAVIGTLLGLVMVRDPIRIFEVPFTTGKMAQADAARRPRFVSTMGSPFGRTPTSKLPAYRPPIWRRLRLGWIFAPAFLAGILVLLTALEAAPYYALRLARLHDGELASDPAYGERLQKAVRVFPLSSQIHAKLGQHYREQAQTALEVINYENEIRTSFEKAIKLNPYDPDNYEMLYYLHRDTGNSPEALRVIKQGVRNNPNHLLLRLLLVYELEKVGNLALATYHVKQIVFRIAPESVELYLRLAELYMYQGRVADATLYYNYARQVVPETPQATARLQRLRDQLKLPS